MAAALALRTVIEVAPLSDMLELPSIVDRGLVTGGKTLAAAQYFPQGRLQIGLRNLRSRGYCWR